MHTAIRLSHTCCHWLMVGSLMLAAGFGLDALCIHVRVALAQWLNGRVRTQATRAWARRAD